jgi:hypothetical protein
VISRGDDELVSFDDRAGWHFPQVEGGVWAGHYPATAKEAIDHLRQLELAGARYLAIPASSWWWLDYYGGLRTYLEQCARLIWRDWHCSIFQLSSSSGEGARAT